MRRRLPTVLRERDYRRLLSSSLAYGFGREMTFVAVGWQVYDISRNPLHLGLIGLAEFLPLLLFALPAGAISDHFSRKHVYLASLLVDAAITGGLLAVSLSGADELWPFLALSFASGCSAAVGNPAIRSMWPTLVPLELLTRALALRSTAGQAAVVTGPALGGLLFALSPQAVYGTAIALMLLAALATVPIRPRVVEQGPVEIVGTRLGALLAGLRFVRRTPVLLGAITLDLVAVLFGGAVALLPLFARDVLEVGPVGLGVLRSAPAIGALLAGIMLTRRPLQGNAGRKLLVVVAVFGVSMVAFGLSKWFPLSFAALAVSGFVDMISMNIRSMITALATPDALRGRVNAVEMVFISASNELGAFESGAAAALVGAVPAVVAGGCVTIAAALVWPRLFPAIARIDRLESLKPAET
jgi:predicted MFS family arabinose efflux permease